MITPIQTGAYSADNTIAPEATLLEALAVSSSTADGLATESELAAANLSETPSSSTLSQAITSLQKLLENLIDIVQNLFTTAPVQIQRAAATHIPSDLSPFEEPPVIIPVPEYIQSEESVVTLPHIETALESEPTPTTTPVKQTTKPKTTKKTKPSSTKGTTKTNSKKKSNTTATNIKPTIVGNGEFLWKPKSDKDGKLAVLLPKRYTGKIRSLEVVSSADGSTLAKGNPSGVGNGEREHFRFDRTGGSFPDGSIVLAILNDGRKIYSQIKDTAQRFSY